MWPSVQTAGDNIVILILKQGEKQVKEDRQKIDTSKRDFMKKSALAGAGVVATATVSGEAVAAVTDDDSQTRQDRGYQLTSHVLEYYKTAAS